MSELAEKESSEWSVPSSVQRRKGRNKTTKLRRINKSISTPKMSARVLSPAMDLTRELNLLASSSSSSSCTSSSLAGTKELGAKRNARRNLFGPPDPRSVQFAREKVEEIKAGSQKYWNFDFERELPLEGRYKWERVGTGEVPTAYACQRLPLLGSSAVATPIKPSTSSSSCTTTTRTSADNYYYIPTSTTCNSQFGRREPLLSVSARIITRSQSSTTTASSSSSSSVSTGPQAGTSVAISQYSSSSGDEISSHRRSTSGHLSQTASLPLSTPAKGIFAVPSIPSVSSSSSSSTSSSVSSSSTSSSKSDDVKCKVQVKSTKQTKMSDYCKVRKRRAEPETVPSIVEKKAAL